MPEPGYLSSFRHGPWPSLQEYREAGTGEAAAEPSREAPLCPASAGKEGALQLEEGGLVGL